MGNYINLMLDSGAYSAWRQKENISLGEYIEYIRDNEASLDSYVNLDVIPGEFGRKPTSKEVEVSARIGWENFCAMRECGLSPIPVYHQGESLEWLQKMIDVCDYVGISPANDRNTAEKVRWLDDVFEFLCNAEGWSCVKTHAFGVTAISILFRYPWYSVDSLTWLLVAAYGGIFVPPVVEGRFDYSQSPTTVFVSDRPAISHCKGGRHFSTFGSATKKSIERYVGQFGFKVVELADDYTQRGRVNCHYFREVEKEHKSKPFHVKRTRGFA